MKSDAPLIRGAKAIAHELGCSPRTISKLVAEKRLPARHGLSGGRTSPLVIERKALDDFKRGRKD